MITLALDLSTHASGVAIFKDKELLGANCITSSSTDLYKRIHKMVDSIIQIIQDMNVEAVVMEEVIPDHVKNTKTFKALMYLQSYFVITLDNLFPKLTVEFVYPGTWRSKVGIQTGRGIKREALKAADIERANSLFATLATTSDDIADAVLIGAAHLGIGAPEAGKAKPPRNWSTRS